MPTRDDRHLSSARRLDLPLPSAPPTLTPSPPLPPSLLPPPSVPVSLITSGILLICLAACCTCLLRGCHKAVRRMDARTEAEEHQRGTARAKARAIRSQLEREFAERAITVDDSVAPCVQARGLGLGKGMRVRRSLFSGGGTWRSARSYRSSELSHRAARDSSALSHRALRASRTASSLASSLASSATERAGRLSSRDSLAHRSPPSSHSQRSTTNATQATASYLSVAEQLAEAGVQLSSTRWRRGHAARRVSPPQTRARRAP